MIFWTGKGEMHLFWFPRKPTDLGIKVDIICCGVSKICLAGEVDETPEEGQEWTKDLVFQDNFLIKSKGVLRKVKSSDINYIESDWNYCTLYGDEKKYAVKMSLKKIQELFGDKFVPIHKSYLVQFDRIEGIDTSANKVILENVTVPLPLGRTFRESLMKRFTMLK